jgi:hypothetical protein
MGRWIIFAFTLPWTLTIGYGWILLMRLGAAHKLRWEKTAVLTAEWKPWVVKRWHYSTTLGRGIIYQPGLRADPGTAYTRIQEHEHVHVRQIEDLMLLSFVLGLVLGLFTHDWLLGLIVWTSGGMWQLPGFVTAVLRGGNIYRDSEHELSAYAQSDLDLDGPDGKSWLDKHRVQKF